MRGAAALLVVAGVVVACSSESTAACKIPGTYRSVVVGEKGDCPSDGDAIITISSGAASNRYEIAIEGFTGSCSAESTEACKLTAHCEARVTETPDGGAPVTGTLTAQYAWTFTETGYSGTSVVTAPPFPSLPGGCRSEAQVKASRL